MKKWTTFLVISLAYLTLGPCNLGFGTQSDEQKDAVSAGKQMIDIMFVIDNSGSMKINDPNFITKQVVTDFTNTLNNDTRIGMVLFDADARITLPLVDISQTKSIVEFKKGLEKVDYRGKFTNSPAGIERAIYELKNRGRKKAQKTIIFLTDGIVDTGNKTIDREKTAWLKDELSKESKKLGIRIISIALTEKADIQLIQSLAVKTDGEYFRAFRANEIPNIFEKINRLIHSADTVAAGRPATPASPSPEVASPPSEMTSPVRSKKIVSGDDKQDKADKTIFNRVVDEVEAYQSPQALFTRGLIPLLILMIALILFCGVIYLLFMKTKSPSSSIPANIVQAPIPRKIETEKQPEATLIDVENVSAKECLPIEINKKRTTIGRDPSNDIVIPQKTISSFHATIEFKDGYFYLEDNRSTNRTSINNKLIGHNDSVRLKSGDKIYFAVYEFRFLVLDQIPVGETVMLGSSSMSLHFHQDSNESEHIDDIALFKNCVDQHLKKINALGTSYQSFAHCYINNELIDVLSYKVKELMGLAQNDMSGHTTSLAKAPINYNICALPEKMENAKHWFHENYGGFTQFLGSLLNSDQFADCNILCVISYGRTEDDAWISMTVVQTDSDDDAIEIMSVELLTDEEKKTLSLEFGNMGNVI